MKIDEDIILIAGPTASGKTRLAIELAQSNNALIINADSMQIYEELRIVTARPTEEEEAAAAHHLFGYISGTMPYSVAHWLDAAKAFLNRGQKLIFVGGTGMYFSSLLNGLSPMPEIDPDIRQKWRMEKDRPAEELHRLLDEAAARQILPTDRQRIIRALEVFESTGRSIVAFQSQKGESILPPNCAAKKLLVMPERALLRDRIDLRFDLMMEQGALDEVRNLVSLGYPNSVPVMKAIGVPHLARHLDGEVSMQEAVEQAKAASRQYAKRQSTWFRNTFDKQWEIVE